MIPAAASRVVPRYGRLRVLVVDDDWDARELLVGAVTLLGHECVGARDGEDAWEKHQAAPFDVIVSDWCMPRMDGIELCRRIRRDDGESRYTYFILTTAFGNQDHFLRGMEAGADDFHEKPVHVEELQARLCSAARVVGLYARLRESGDAARRESRSSFEAARADPLTGVANRLRMNEDLEVLFSRGSRYGHKYGVALCDIDWFKEYNDKHGHLAGDEVLRQVAQTIQGELRQGDGLYRYGGEEFLVVLPEQSLAESAHAMERVRDAVYKRAFSSAVEGHVVTISIGVAALRNGEDETAERWIKRADAALYRAKENGRNRVEIDDAPPSSSPSSS